MEEKSKFIIIALVGVLAISLFVNLQTHNSRRAVQKYLDDARTENELLLKKIEEGKNTSQNLLSKISALNTDIDKLHKEVDNEKKAKDELEKKYADLLKQRDQLMDKIKTMQEAGPSVKAERAEYETPDAYWARLLKSKADLEIQIEKIRTEFKTAQINNEYLQREKNNLELELNSLAQEKKMLENEIEYHKKQVDGMATDLVREKNSARRYEDALKFVKGENTILKRQLKALNDYKLNVEKKLAQYQDDKSRMERRFDEMGELLEDRVSKIGDIKDKIETIRSGGGFEEPKQQALQPQLEEKKSVELPPIVVRPQSEIPAAVKEEHPLRTTVKGKILSIDKENNFVVINLGTDAGIKNGDSFQVYRKDELVGAVEVTEARKKISACDIKKEIAPIKIGDVLIIRQ